MKTIKNIVLMLSLGLLPLMANSQTPANGKLTVEIEGIQSKEGSIRILLFNNEKVFPDRHYAFFNIAKDLSKELPVEIFDVPFGQYAVLVFHDQNNNGKLDRGFFGKACEANAYSELPIGYCKAPSFDKAAFDFKEDGMKVKIILGCPDNMLTTKNPK